LEGKWDKPVLKKLGGWMSDKMVSWMLIPYRRGAYNAEEAWMTLQSVASRSDSHMVKVLCDLRFVITFLLIRTENAVARTQEIFGMTSSTPRAFWAQFRI
jgi:hypothetical protein